MSSKWYYHSNGKNAGPISSQQLREAAKIVLVQRELDKSVLQLKDFSCLGQIMNPPLAGLFYQVFSGIAKL